MLRLGRASLASSPARLPGENRHAFSSAGCTPARHEEVFKYLLLGMAAYAAVFHVAVQVTRRQDANEGRTQHAVNVNIVLESHPLDSLMTSAPTLSACSPSHPTALYVPPVSNVGTDDAVGGDVRACE